MWSCCNYLLLFWFFYIETFFSSYFLQCTMLGTEDTIIGRCIPPFSSCYFEKRKRRITWNAEQLWTVIVTREIQIEYLDGSPNIVSDNHENFSLTLRILWLGSNFPAWSFRNSASICLRSQRYFLFTDLNTSFFV